MKASKIALLIAVLTVLVLAGGSMQNTPGQSDKGLPATDDTGSAEGKTELSFWTYPKWKGIRGYEYDGQLGDWERYVADQFEKEYAGVSVNVNVLKVDGGRQKINVAIASGSQPDILLDSTNNNLEYIRRGLAVPLDSYISPEEEEQYIDGVLYQCTSFDGKQYMIPWTVNMKFMLVNRSIFKNAGAEHLLPHDEFRTWTYNAFKEALRAVSKPENNLYGCGLYAGNEIGDDATLAMIENFGAKLIDYDQTNYPRSVIHSDSAAKAAAFLRSLIEEQLTVPGAEALKASDCEKLFAAGKLAVLINGSLGTAAATKALMEQGKCKWFEIYPVLYPTESENSRQIYHETSAFIVFRSEASQTEKAAVDFCKTITGSSYINDIKPSLNFSAYKNSKLDYQGEGITEYGKRLMPFSKGFYSDVNGFWRIRTVFYPVMKALYASPEKSLKVLFEDLSSRIQSILDENYRE